MFAWLIVDVTLIPNSPVAAPVETSIDANAVLTSAWVPVKLDTTHPTAIALFATIITTTPGTVSCVVDELRGEILVHALDCDDPAGAAEQMKARYERPLREIFES